SWSDYSAAEAQAFFAQQRQLEFNRDDSWFQLAVERREDGALLGDVAVHFFDEGRQAELGVTFDPVHQRQG
ncbi:GNAT family N-acetyltransferase, partial [Serratia marcescens]